MNNNFHYYAHAHCPLFACANFFFFLDSIDVYTGSADNN